MLVLTGRGFDGAQFLGEVAATRARFPDQLTSAGDQLTSAGRPPLLLLRDLPDGSFPSLIGGVKVRLRSG
jgi:hypothetical protein